MADTKLSDLSASGALAGTELFYSDSGAADVKVTATQLKTWTSSSPTLVTPALGTPTSGNLVSCTGYVGTSALTTTGTLVSGATGAGFTVALGTSTVSGILGSANGGTANGFTKFTGPTGSEKTFTLPDSSQALAALDLASQTLAGGANVTALTQTSGNLTFNPGLRPLQYQNNGGAFTLTAPANDGSGVLLSTNVASAGAITFSGFTVGSSVGDALTTSSGNKFSIHIWRINSVSGYRVAAHQ